ncbi:MAG: HIT family hydrolase [Bacteroidetes bacterium GWF2_38_335]|nr:MAG: HIT family hydrolase [Bacteroidetes bacterium GWF2_38_335]OFY80668.1 MAG: HIT family hydrolase [Bacteroidetes bacterium RIFOXYA12_FULL_38_20]HBS87011.1 HIT family protein [Bacteroidales bacterium]
MASIFTKIIKGEIPCYKISENEKFFAFLDINPLMPGHTLIVPKVETDRYFDLPDTTLAEMTVFSKKIAKAIEKVVPCDRVGVVVLGLEVPHAHVHLIPLNSMDDINFARPKLKLSNEEFSAIAEKIRNEID